MVLPVCRAMALRFCRIHAIKSRRMGRGPAGVLAVVALAGCLSGGPPPAGRRLVAGRGDFDRMVLLSTPSVTGLLLYRRPDLTTPGEEIHFIRLPADGDESEAPQDLLLAASALDMSSLTNLPSVDSHGRLVLGVDPQMSPVDGSFSSKLVLVDLLTGNREALGVGSYQLSPSGARLVYGTNVAGVGARLR